MHNPLVTIIVICYNHAAYLEQCIQSVYGQEYKNIELIVTDDYSQDGSRELLQKLSQQHGFLFLPNEMNIGLNNTIIHAMSHSTGELISVISSDDYLGPDKISRQVAYLSETGKDGVYANGFSVDGKVITPIAINPVFSKNDKQATLKYIYTYDWGAPLLQSGLFRKTVFFELAPLRKEFKSDDWAFIIRAFEQYDIGFMNERLFYYRIHEFNTHKRYWFTFPMRMDIIARLVPDQYRYKAFANIMMSQGQYLLADKKFFRGIRFFLASTVCCFSFSNIVSMMKSIAVFFRDLFVKKEGNKK